MHVPYAQGVEGHPRAAAWTSRLREELGPQVYPTLSPAKAPISVDSVPPDLVLTVELAEEDWAFIAAVLRRMDDLDGVAEEGIRYLDVALRIEEQVPDLPDIDPAVFELPEDIDLDAVEWDGTAWRAKDVTAPDDEPGP